MYFKLCFFSDERVKDWLLMQYFSPTLLLVLKYLLVIWAGKKVMASREPFKLRWVIFVYNVSMVLLNAHIVYEVDFTCSLITKGSNISKVIRNKISLLINFNFTSEVVESSQRGFLCCWKL